MEENEKILKEILDKVKGKKNVSKELLDFLKGESAKHLVVEDLKDLSRMISGGLMIDKEVIAGLRRAGGLNRNKEVLNQTDRRLLTAKEALKSVQDPLTKSQVEGRERADNWERPLTDAQVAGRERSASWTEDDRPLTQAQIEGRRRSETWPDADPDSTSSSTGSGKNTTGTSNARVREDVKPVDSAPDLDLFDQQLLDLKSKLSGLGISVDESKLPSGTSPANQAYLDKRFKVKNFLEDFKSTLGPIVSVIDHISAAKETREANRLVDKSMRESPAMPSVRGRNRVISSLIRENNIARGNPMQFVQPQLDQNNIGYNQDVRRAEELSGGQAGVATGLAQGASLRRDANNRQAGLMGAEIYGEGLDRAGDLAQVQMQDDASRDSLNMQRSQYLIDNNRQDQIAAGQALASTKARELQTRNNMYGSLLDSPIFDVDTYMNLTKQNLRGI